MPAELLAVVCTSRLSQADSIRVRTFISPNSLCTILSSISFSLPDSFESVVSNFLINKTCFSCLLVGISCSLS